MRKAGEEEDWKKKTRDRGGWKILSDEGVKKLRAARTSPLTKGKEEGRDRWKRSASELLCYGSLNFRENDLFNMGNGTI